jgi:hypothetical protein
MQLTSLDKFKAYAGITDTDDDDALRVIIPAVSALVAKRCYRDFELQTYKQWLISDGGRTFRLPQYPVTALRSVSWNVDHAMDVKFTGGTRATVAFDGTTLTLHSISTSGVETETTITVASYPTITLLAAEIETNSGWSTTVYSQFANEYTPIMMPFDTQWALSPDKAELDTPYDSQDVRVLSRTAGTLESEGGGFPAGHLFCWYKAGYTLPSDGAGVSDGNVPGALELVVNMIVADVLDYTHADGVLANEKVGDYQAAIGQAVGGSNITMMGFINKHLTDLQPFINHTVD